MHNVLSPVLLLGVVLIASLAHANPVQPVISIIIDDLGNNLAAGQRAIALPGAITYAILPHGPFSLTLAQQAHQQGKEVMLHMPMDNRHDYPLGPGALTEALDYQSYRERLQRAIMATPHLSGINNHMGSRLTENPQRMRWLMQTLKQYPLYFIDSRTSARSVAARTASEYQIPALQRDVFLDHDRTPAAIAGQFEKLLTIARRQGHALAIGHPYPSTLTYLEHQLPQLAAQGIRLVTPSTLLARVRQPAPTLDTQSPVDSYNAPSQRCQLEELPDIIRVTCG